MGLRLQLCKALTFLGVHRLDCEHCNVYWRCYGEQMRKRLRDLRRQEPQDSNYVGLLVGPERVYRPKGTRFTMEKAPYKNHEPTKEWCEVAEEIVNERDPKKVVELSEELLRALDQQKKDIA
jgi:hypothetical protein